MNTQKPSRRELLSLGVPALAGAALATNVEPVAADDVPKVAVTADSAQTGGAWPVRRKKIERAWLDLLGEFPTEILPLEPVMKEVAKENGVTRYHVSFQAEADDR